ncbi:MAG: hypothetical protein ACK57R_14880, partial [Dolichospermum sp.]
LNVSICRTDLDLILLLAFLDIIDVSKVGSKITSKLSTRNLDVFLCNSSTRYLIFPLNRVAAFFNLFFCLLLALDILLINLSSLKQSFWILRLAFSPNHPKLLS